MEELEALQRFQRALNDDDGRAWYGLEEITKALNMDAVRYLMVSDALFRSDDIEERDITLTLPNKLKP